MQRSCPVQGLRKPRKCLGLVGALAAAKHHAKAEEFVRQARGPGAPCARASARTNLHFANVRAQLARTVFRVTSPSPPTAIAVPHPLPHLPIYDCQLYDRWSRCCTLWRLLDRLAVRAVRRMSRRGLPASPSHAFLSRHRSARYRCARAMLTRTRRSHIMYPRTQLDVFERWLPRRATLEIALGIWVAGFVVAGATSWRMHHSTGGAHDPAATVFDVVDRPRPPPTARSRREL